jgi:energy-coupling factor transporter ATP-binding protein EcfA2
MTAALEARPGAAGPAVPGPGGGGTVLELAAVTKIYPSAPPVTALRGVDLTVAAGELVAVLGPSGSGKSTLLHLMGTLDRPSAGTVRVTGLDTAALSDRDLAGLRATSMKLVKVLTTATEASEMPMAAGIPSSRTRPDVCRMKRRPAPGPPAVAVPADASLLATAYLQAPASANGEKGSRMRTQFTCVIPQADLDALART